MSMSPPARSVRHLFCYWPRRAIVRDPTEWLSHATHYHPGSRSLSCRLSHPAHRLQSIRGNGATNNRRLVTALKSPNIAPCHPSFTSSPAPPPVSLVLAHGHSAGLPCRDRDRDHRMPLLQSSILVGLADPNQRRLTGHLVFISPSKETDQKELIEFWHQTQKPARCFPDIIQLARRANPGNSFVVSVNGKIA